jgi:type IV secretory pathway VirB2 component (pilin)
MNTTAPRAATFVLFFVLCSLQVSPALAQFTGAGSQATNWFVQLITPLVPLACAVVGIACMTGRVNWGWFLAAFCGTALFFGRDQVVSMFRGWLSV